jgi:AraC-like DNA-binding protein
MHAYVDQLLAQVRLEHRTSIELLVQWMREDMRRSIDKPRTLNQYAASAGVSVSHLSRCFSSNVGQTFRQEQQQIRMESASRLLTDTTLKISAISKLVGLPDPSQFTCDFRRKTGLTPGAYRLSHLVHHH